MDKSSLAAQLRAWSQEFFEVRNETPYIPDGLWPFLARRCVESQALSGVQEDDDVVRARIGKTIRLIRLTGCRNGRISYEFADGEGWGLIQGPQIHDDDQHKAAEALDRLENA